MTPDFRRRSQTAFEHRAELLRLKNHWPLLGVLLIYLTVAVAHSLIVPLTTGNDEWAHFLYVRFIREHGHLPATTAERSEAGYKADAPPLYQLIVAAVTAGIEPTRLLRPIDSPRRQLADNAVTSYIPSGAGVLVHTAVELPPYQGEVLLWHRGRGVSIFFGLVTIGLTYLTSLELSPLRVQGSNRQRALLAAGLVAFMPAFIFHSSVLSYESLSAALTAAFLLVSIRAIKQPEQWRWWIGMGLLAGLALITKYSAILLPLEIIFVAWLALANRQAGGAATSGSSYQLSLKRIFLAGAVMLLVASGWFGFLIWNFNTVTTQGPVIGLLQPLLVGDGSDTTSVKIASFLFGEAAVEGGQRPPLERNYPQLLRALLDSFWAAPVAGQFFLSPWLPLLFTLLALTGLIGLWPAWQKTGTAGRTWLMLLMVHAGLIVPLLIIRILFSFDPREAAQGRHLLLPATSAIAILLVWGWQQARPKIGRLTLAGLLLWTVVGQLGWAVAAYPPPMPVWSEQPPAAALQARPIGHSFGHALELMGVTWRETPGTPSLEVSLWWQALATMKEDYLVELALLDEVGTIVSYTLGQPVQGRYPTRAWEPGDVVQDFYGLPLIGPLQGVYQLQLRLLTRTGQPLPEVKPLRLGEVEVSGRPASDSVQPCTVWSQGRPGSIYLSPIRPQVTRPYRLRSTFTVISPEPPKLKPVPQAFGREEQGPFISVGSFHLFMVEPDWFGSYELTIGSTPCQEILVDTPARNFSPPSIPQPLEVNFNDEIQLLGYELPTRRIEPGGRLPLTLYWRALAYMGEDYRIFDNLLDSEQRRWGGYDRRPRDGYSTLLWAPGEVITDAFGVPVDPGAPDGIYTLDIGLYRETAAGAEPLPLVQAGQPLQQTSIRLGPIKVGGPPPGTTTVDPTPEVTLNQSLDGRVTLLGYDLMEPNDQSGQQDTAVTLTSQPLTLTLYWQVEAPVAVDYTTFFHLRDATNQNVAQQDNPPAAGRYPTSLWDVGEVIVDEISLPLVELPSGRYTPVVGLYNLVTGERLPVSGNPANEITLNPIEIR